MLVSDTEYKSCIIEIVTNGVVGSKIRAEIGAPSLIAGIGGSQGWADAFETARTIRDFCSPFKFVVVSRPQPRACISLLHVTKENKVQSGRCSKFEISWTVSTSFRVGAVRLLRQAINGNARLLVDSSRFSIIPHERGYICATAETASDFARFHCEQKKKKTKTVPIVFRRLRKRREFIVGHRCCRRRCYATVSSWKVELIPYVPWPFLSRSSNVLREISRGICIPRVAKAFVQFARRNKKRRVRI